MIKARFREFKSLDSIGWPSSELCLHLAHREKVNKCTITSYPRVEFNEMRILAQISPKNSKCADESFFLKIQHSSEKKDVNKPEGGLILNVWTCCEN